MEDQIIDFTSDAQASAKLKNALASPHFLYFIVRHSRTADQWKALIELELKLESYAKMVIYEQLPQVKDPLQSFEGIYSVDGQTVIFSLNTNERHLSKVWDTSHSPNKLNLLKLTTATEGGLHD